MASSSTDRRTRAGHQLRLVRQEIARLEGNLPSGDFLRSDLTPEQQDAFDRTGPLYEREQKLMGIEWGARLLPSPAGRIRFWVPSAGPTQHLHHGARHRRAPGRRPVRRRGSRRTGSGSRAGPDDPDEADSDELSPLLWGWDR